MNPGLIMLRQARMMELVEKYESVSNFKTLIVSTQKIQQ